MSIRSAQSIRNCCRYDERGYHWTLATGMIHPFVGTKEKCIRSGMSFGLSACGYDIRIDSAYTIMPGTFILAASFERFKIPNDLCMRILDKSSWARQGVFIQNTIAEPGWEGFLTLEISNNSHQLISIERGYPIAQCLFEQLDQPTELPYRGKYQEAPPGPQQWIHER